MESKDITVKWVKENYNIDEERQEKEVVVESGDLHLEAACISNFLDTLKKYVDEFKKKYNIKSSDNVGVRDRICYEDREIFLFAAVNVPETDQEVIDRLQKKAKRAIKNIKDEQQEMKLYLRLKNKYEEEGK